jgi:hypothetical protein
MTYSCPGSFSARLDTKARLFPSGDQRGSPSRRSPVVNRRGGSEPSTGANQTLPRYSFASPSMDQTTYATVLPSGLRRGSETPSSA